MDQPLSIPIPTLCNDQQVHREDQGIDAVLIATIWHNQVWYPRLLEALVSKLVLLPMTHSILRNLQEELHPLLLDGHLPLAAWPVLGKSFTPEVFLKELSQSSRNIGRTPLTLSLEKVG